MISRLIPFVVPSEFEALRAVGEVQRYGALLKNVSTGQIVGHVQETGAFQSLLSSAVGSGPVGSVVNAAVGGATIVQNEQIKGKIDAMQSMIGNMQSLQVGTLLTSVAGLGVTVASTMVILNRMKKLEDMLGRMEDKLDAFQNLSRDLQLKTTLQKIETQLERLSEVPARKDAEPIVKDAEAALHEGFNALHAGTLSVVAQVKIDDDLLRSLLEGLAVSGGAQVQSLLWLDEKEAARARAARQAEKLQELAFRMPQDVLGKRLAGGSESAQQLSNAASELRLRTASMPSLAQRLNDTEVHGRAYLDTAQQEGRQPLLILPAA